MKKAIKYFTKQIKKGIRSFFELCDVCTKKLASYKKVWFIIILIAILLGVIAYGKGMVDDTVSKTIVVSEKEIIKRVSKYTSIPNAQPLSIVRVEDAETLKEQHIFYQDVKEGDYVIVYEDRVIIYDLRGDRVVSQKFLQP